MFRFLLPLSGLLLFALSDSAFGKAPRPARTRLASAGFSTLAEPDPVIRSISSNGKIIWLQGQSAPARLSAGAVVTVTGTGFGAGTEGDHSKLLVGNVRALERDLPMFEGAVHLLQALFFEKKKLFDTWSKDVRSWSDTEIVFRVPVTASRGPLVVSVQSRVGAVEATGRPGIPLLVQDPLLARVEGLPARKLPLSRLGSPRLSNEVPLEVDNPSFDEDAKAGEAIYWAYDYNIGLVHAMRGLDWRAILRGTASNLVTGGKADPQALFGAIPARRGEVPDVALGPYEFHPYPMPTPLKPLLRSPLLEGKTTPTGFVGYVYAEAINVVSQRKGNWIGFNCASCHSQRIIYEDRPGSIKARVFPGLPNPKWSMKWNTLGAMKGVKTKKYDKTRVIWAIPEGTGESTMVREAGDGSRYDDDGLFSPIAIPIITRHTPVRRALSHGESISGFEGSYIHSEEPDGAIGAMHAKSLQQLTAYMSTLDSEDMLLERLSLYRHLKRTGSLADVDSIGEGQFVQTGKDAFPRLMNRLERGRAAFGRDCLSCHRSNFGTWSDEDMFPLTEVGTFFSPTLFQREQQSIRTAMLKNLFWVEPRGLLHDGHVKSLEDLVHPDRCDEKSDLYRKYYTLHQGGFSIPKGNALQEAALRKQAYFVDVPWDRDRLYWDYQTMRKEFGPKEVGSPVQVALPAAPHPWCASAASDVADLVLYLTTL